MQALCEYIHCEIASDWTTIVANQSIIRIVMLAPSEA